MHQKRKQSIFFCGMMGTGKSVIGKIVAGRLNLPFYDLDSLIESDEEITISEIFKNEGESGFRKIERKRLMEFVEKTNGVLALGGGSLQDQKIVNLLKDNGILIFIDTPKEILLERLTRNNRRPMLTNLDINERMALIGKLLQERRPYYEQAHITVSGALKNPNSISDLIINNLNQYDV